MSRLRFVFDFNMIVSAGLLANSIPRQAFEFAISQGELLLSDTVQLELSEVLRRSKFDKYVSEEVRLRFVVGLLRLAIPVTVTERIDTCRDPKDNKVLELAVSGKAHCIVTGDNDLLVLNPFRGIPILTAADFLHKFAGIPQSGAAGS
jgi:putative PIN family toxin of toxin-antitoxin system